MTRNLADAWSWIDKIVRRIARIESGAFLENSSITNGRMRFIGGTLRVDSGGQVEIVGTLEIDGTTTVTGTFNVTGPWEISGDGEIAGFLRITGPTEINGPTTINGNFWVNGFTRLANDLIIDSGGRIVAGNLVITPTANGGSMKFASGPEVYADGTQLALYSGTGSFIELNGSMAKINGPGARWFEVNGSGFRFVNLPTRGGTGLPAGAVGADADGTLWRAS